MLIKILYKRPRLINFLHKLRLIKAYSQTNKEELASLEKYSFGKKRALEIGSFMGISAVKIAKSMYKSGKLYCIDPWEAINNKENPCKSIFDREMKINRVEEKVDCLLGYSTDMFEKIPCKMDFIFVDGDHSYKGLENDWKIVCQYLKVGGVVCLHDTKIPKDNPSRNFGSVDFFNNVILQSEEYKLLETVYSMNILLRIK